MLAVRGPVVKGEGGSSRDVARSRAPCSAGRPWAYNAGMKSSSPIFATVFALAFAAFAASACQKTAPDAAPAPEASASPAPAASALPQGHPPLGGGTGAAPGGAGALPPGHPPMGGAGGAAMPQGHPPLSGGGAGAASTAPPLGGTVALAPSIAERAGGAKALYVIARKAGTRDIVAVKKIDAPKFPAAFELSGSDVMVSGTAFAGPFDLTARLTLTGDAIPSAGDLEGATKNVAAGTKDVKITLDSVRQ